MMKLIFIYKAGSGIFENIPGAVKKAFGGASDCALCNITHGPVREKETWKNFVARLGSRAVFYHKDEIPPKISAFLRDARIDMPVVLEERPATFKTLVTADELAACRGDEQKLINIIQSKTS